MAKQFTTISLTHEPPPEPEPSGITPAMVKLAQKGDREALAHECATRGYAGVHVADLFILAVQVERKYGPVAADVEAADEEMQAAMREKEALQRFRPDSVEAARQLAEAEHENNVRWAKAANRHGEAKVAQLVIAFLHSYLPDLFGKQPQPNNRVTGCMGYVPELVAWFERHKVNPNGFNSWMNLNRVRETSQRRRRIIAPEPRRQNSL